jgi:hypothetical protein
MSSRFMAFLAVCVAALALVVPSALSAPAATSVQLGKNAALLAPGQIAVPVVFQCPQGVTGGVFVSVSQQQPTGPNTTGFGQLFPVVCDGSKQMLTVLVNGGPFNLGPAFASAEGFWGATFAFDSRVITIG